MDVDYGIGGGQNMMPSGGFVGPGAPSAPPQIITPRPGTPGTPGTGAPGAPGAPGMPGGMTMPPRANPVEPGMGVAQPQPQPPSVGVFPKTGQPTGPSVGVFPKTGQPTGPSVGVFPKTGQPTESAGRPGQSSDLFPDNGPPITTFPGRTLPGESPFANPAQAMKPGSATVGLNEKVKTFLDMIRAGAGQQRPKARTLYEDLGRANYNV
jgi:hypothetical protein